MIGAGAGDGRRRLDHVEPVHRVVRTVQLAAAVKLPDVANVTRAARQEIGVQRKNNVSLFRTIDGADVATERQLAAFARAVAARRLPLVPLGARNLLQDTLDLRGDGWGCNCASEN